jgi:hypothetical protein
MVHAETLPAIRHCFCEIAARDLMRWARLKFIEGASTMALLRLAASPQEREAIGIVALLDVPDDDIVRLLRPVAPSHCNVLVCRDHLREWLRSTLAFPGGHEVRHG